MRKRRLEKEKDVRECIDSLSEPLRIVERRKGDHGRDLKETDLKSVGRPDLHPGKASEVDKLRQHSHRRIGPEGRGGSKIATNERAMFPLRAKEHAFMNSVAFGTTAKRTTPRSFSSNPVPSRMESTTSTRISRIAKEKVKEQR
jgi:hypothetical protein